MCVLCFWRQNLQRSLPLPQLPQLDKKIYVYVFKKSAINRPWCNTGERRTAGLGSPDYPYCNPALHTCWMNAPSPTQQHSSSPNSPPSPPPSSSLPIRLDSWQQRESTFPCASCRLTMIVIPHPRRNVTDWAAKKRTKRPVKAQIQPPSLLVCTLLFVAWMDSYVMYHI